MTLTITIHYSRHFLANLILSMNILRIAMSLARKYCKMAADLLAPMPLYWIISLDIPPHSWFSTFGFRQPMAQGQNLVR